MYTCECLFRQGCHHQAPGTTTGTTNIQRLDFEVGLSTAFAVARPVGKSPRSGEHMPPRRGEPTKKGGGGGVRADSCMQWLCTNWESLPGGAQYSVNPTNRTNRLTNRARHLRNLYKPYKPSYEPCTASEEFLQTVQTVLQTVHGVQGIPTNRTNRISGHIISTTPIVTVCTVCRNSLDAVHGL